MSSLLILTTSRNLVPPTRILIFSHFSERDGTALLRCIAKSLRDSNLQIQHVIFSTYDERRDGRTRIGICSCGNVRIEHELISFCRQKSEQTLLARGSRVLCRDLEGF